MTGLIIGRDYDIMDFRRTDHPVSEILNRLTTPLIAKTPEIVLNHAVYSQTI